jgi:hypothetical protein
VGLHVTVLISFIHLRFKQKINKKKSCKELELFCSWEKVMREKIEFSWLIGKRPKKPAAFVWKMP